MNDIVKTQKANGSWQFKQVEWITSVSVDRFQSSLPVVHDNSQAVEGIWATSIVLVVLQIFFSSIRNEWVLVEQKAIKWLKRTLVSVGQDANKLNEILEKARQFVHAQKIQV